MGVGHLAVGLMLKRAEPGIYGCRALLGWLGHPLILMTAFSVLTVVGMTSSVPPTCDNPRNLVDSNAVGFVRIAFGLSENEPHKPTSDRSWSPNSLDRSSSFL